MNSNSAKDFLFRHFEKFIFGTLVLLAVFLVYQGFQMPDYLREQKPEAMEKGATEVKNLIDDDHWEELAEPRLATIDVVARTNASIRPVNPQRYSLSPWEAKIIESSVRREDPMIPAPIELLATGVISTVAYKTADAEYPLKTLEPAEAVEKAPEPKRPPPRRRRPPVDASYPGSEDFSMDTDYAQMGQMGPMGAGGGASTPGLPQTRKIDSKYDLGFRPPGTPGDLAPATGHFIAGVALMPHKQIYSAFEAALAQGEGYNPRRDLPIYVGFQVQRADVTQKAVDQLADADWVTRPNSAFLEKLLIHVWAGMAKEIVAAKYRDAKLTTPIPPVLLTHYAHFASHPKIPLGDEDPRATQRPGRRTAPTGPIIFNAEQDLFSDQGRSGRGRQGMAGGGGMGGMAGGMPGGMGGMAGGMPGGMGGMGMGGMGMGGMFGAQGMAEQPENKLIRFYDFRDFSGTDPTAPQPGRLYVYRLRIAVEDPNFPRDPTAQPRSSTLSADVFRRVQKLSDEAAKTKRRNFVRYSEWSAPSPAVSLPSMSVAYAGPVTPPPSARKLQVNGRDVEYSTKPPVGKLVVAQWDTTYHVPVPIFTDVLRGSVLAKTGQFEVPDPLEMVVKKTPETTVNTETVVLDLGGGQPLAIVTGENQTEPATMLLFDADGGLRVVDEVESQVGYRLYSFADDRGE